MEPIMSDLKRDRATTEIDRRDFVKLGGAGAAAAATIGASACAPAGSGGTGGEGDAWWVNEAFELEEATFAELSAAMESGERTAVEITRLYLERIEALDRAGPRLRSIIETNPEALEIAQRLDEERAAGNVRGPLHGIPIAVKDNIDTADQMTTTAGSYALEGHHAAQDSGVAAKLREAGAIILAKANLSEWANIRSTRSSSGWSGRGGQCGNAYAVDRNPCGSSSGSGAAASANFCAGAIGTETNGSVVCPASLNGVVGLKPTVGLVSRAGIIPISHTQDTAGPMTRSVADAAAMLTALAGPDPRDAATAESGRFESTDYTSYLDADGLRGARIGIERSHFGNHPDVDALMEDAISAMAAAGATIVDNTIVETRRRFGDPSYQVLLYELKADMAAYLEMSGRPNGMATLADIIAFNEENADREMPYFAQEIFEEANAKGDLLSAEYLEAVATARVLSRNQGIDAVMDEHRLDAIVSPTTTPAWKIDLATDDGSSHGSSGTAAVAGYPSITVPNGYVFGLPVGILFFGRQWSEDVLLRLAYSYEQATQHRRAARLLPSLDLRNRRHLPSHSSLSGSVSYRVRPGRP
jgi:amidase